jgi:hypothetical protein
MFLVLASLGACGQSERKEDLGDVRQHWWIFGKPTEEGYHHQALVQKGLEFLKDDIRESLAAAAKAVDKNPQTKEDSKYHFDNCRFKESTELLNQHYDAILAALDGNAGPYREDSPPWITASQRFGTLLHAVEDFYAHSTWVESGQTQLVDRGLDKWKVLTPWEPVGEGMLVVETQTAAGNDNTLASDLTGQLARELHQLKLTKYLGPGSSAEYLGLMTGRYANLDHGGQSACVEKPVMLSMRHGNTYGLCEPDDVEAECKRRNISCFSPTTRDSGDHKQAQTNYTKVCGDIWLTTYLAKDHPLSAPFDGFSVKEDVEKRRDWRDRAHELSLEQTKHEFCRLARLMDDRYPAGPGTPGGKKRLYDAWVQDPARADAACGFTSIDLGPWPELRDQTQAWKLSGVAGEHVSAVDLDNDGYPELVIREATGQESNLEAGRQRVWVMQNKRGHFEDITTSSGLIRSRVRGKNGAVRHAKASRLLAFADLDNDGDLDAFSGTPTYRPAGLSGVERASILRNEGGVFKDSSLLDNVDLIPSGATFMDYDRDGRVDLFVSARSRRSGWLLRNAATGFTDVTASAGITGTALAPRSVTACDLDGDHLQELLVSSDQRGESACFQARASGQTISYERCADPAFAGDTNHDWRDNRAARAYCQYRRQGLLPHKFMTQEACNQLPGGCPTQCIDFPCDVVLPLVPGDDGPLCANVAPYTGSDQFGEAMRWHHDLDRTAGRLAGNSMAAVCADLDGDGALDLFNATRRSAADGASADPSQVLRNATASNPTGLLTLSRLSPSETGIHLTHEGENWTEDVRGAEVFDLDNDGRLDMLVAGQPARLYKNTSMNKLSFAPVAFPGIHGEGVAAADFDRDGDIDLVVGSPTQVRFIENRGVPSTGWFELKLVGQGGAGKANRSAIGARVTASWANRKLVREVTGGHGPAVSQSDLVLHFGLGLQPPSTVQVDVVWPNATHSTSSFPLTPGHSYEFREGETTPRVGP